MGLIRFTCIFLFVLIGMGFVFVLFPWLILKFYHTHPDGFMIFVLSSAFVIFGFIAAAFIHITTYD